MNLKFPFASWRTAAFAGRMTRETRGASHSDAILQATVFNMK
jgi:hypothetical protein